MRQFADYDFYQNVYHGTDIQDENKFNRMSIESSFFLNELTLGRIKEPSEEVKLAVCAIVDVAYREEKENREDQIASESVGPHSISYVKKTKTTEEYIKEKIKVARTYLANTGLLYRGISSCCF